MVSWNHAMINLCFLTQIVELPTKFHYTLVGEYFDYNIKPTKYLVKKCIGSTFTIAIR
jgi:hypothetical protein